MKKSEELELEFAKRGMRRGGIFVLSPQDALDFVFRCRQEGLRIAGIDGFRITSKTTQPFTEHSVDFSIGSNFLGSMNTWDEAEAFLRARLGLDLFFEIVTES